MSLKLKRPGSKYFLRRNRHHPRQLILDRAACLTQFVFVLQSHPELHGGAQYFGKAQGGVRGDAAFAQHDFVDAARWHADGIGESVWLISIGSRNSSRRISPGCMFFNLSMTVSLMVVNDLDRIGAVWGPLETDTPLVVDADAVLIFAIIF